MYIYGLAKRKCIGALDSIVKYIYIYRYIYIYGLANSKFIGSLD